MSGGRHLWVLAAVLATTAGASAAMGRIAPLVAVDVGHGPTRPGAISARGVAEYDFNLAFALQLQQALEARGLRVRPINFSGQHEPLLARTVAARGADFFISVHHDSVHPEDLSYWDRDGEWLAYSDRHRGFSLFVSRQNPHLGRSLLCGSAVGARLRRQGFLPTHYHAARRPWLDRDNGVHAYDRLVVLSRSSVPGLLLEAGVIKHREEELALRDPLRQARMADAVASGVAACLAVSTTDQ